MKKRITTNLTLNKKLISNLNTESIRGGAQSATNCTPVTACQPTVNNCSPQTQTYCGGNDCVSATGKFCDKK